MFIKYVHRIPLNFSESDLNHWMI